MQETTRPGEIHDVIERWERALGQHDAEALTATYAQDSTPRTMGGPDAVGVSLSVGRCQARCMAEPAPEIVELEPQEAIAVRGDVAIADLPAFFKRAFHEAAKAANASGVAIVGPPFSFYPEMPTQTAVAVEAGFPVSAPAEGHGDAHRLVLPGGRAVQAMHVGPYDTLERTYTVVRSWIAERGLQQAGGMWECYLSDPEVERDPATWRTRIVCPVA